MELIVDFEKLERITRNTSDLALRAQRWAVLASLRKKSFVVAKDTSNSLEFTIAEMRRNVAASVASVRRVTEKLGKSHAALSFAPQLAGSGRTEHPRANQANELRSVDTQRAKFKPVLVTVQPGESVQAAALRAAREDRQTNELDTSPAQPWTKPQDRYMDQPMRPADGEIEKAFRASKAQTNNELERLNVERISAAGSLRCRRCGHEMFAKMFGGKPLDEARKHAEAHALADQMNLSAPSHDLYRSTAGSNRNF